MQALEALTEQARALASGEPLAMSAAEAEVARQMQICNACRYCEGFCAVFPAMTRRLSFGQADVHYLANLCHNCGACLHACQYAPPHEFAVNVPQSMARVRGQTYADYAWPPAFGALYKRNGLVVALTLALALSFFLLLGVMQQGKLWHEPMAGNFYAVFPHNLMVGLFAPVFLFAVLALGLGVRRFWVDVSPGAGAAAGKGAGTGSGGVAASSSAAVGEATAAALKLRYLDGGHGEGCHNDDEGWTHWRRRFHHMTFYGFALCFAATSVATVYHYVLGWQAPYAFFSLPVLLGTAGGVGLLAGPAGLWVLHRRRHPLHGDAAQRPMDLAFIALLFLTSLTGLLLLGLRETGAMAVLLSVHLGVVMALFALMPYGKFAHGVFRMAALLKYAIEKRQPDRLRLGSD